MGGYSDLTESGYAVLTGNVAYKMDDLFNKYAYFTLSPYKGTQKEYA